MRLGNEENGRIQTLAVGTVQRSITSFSPSPTYTPRWEFYSILEDYVSRSGKICGCREEILPLEVGESYKGLVALGSSETSPESGDLLFLPEDCSARAIAFGVATLTLLVAFFVVASKAKGNEWEFPFYQSLGSLLGALFASVYLVLLLSHPFPANE